MAITDITNQHCLGLPRWVLGAITALSWLCAKCSDLRGRDELLQRQRVIRRGGTRSSRKSRQSSSQHS